MKAIVSAILTLIILLALGCERASLFDSRAVEYQDPVLGPSGETAIVMELTGGQAGTYENLTIDSNGYARYLSSSHPQGQMVSILSQEEMGSLIAVFLQEDFFHLENSYVNSRFANSSLYRIYFNHGGTEKLVESDPTDPPEELREIIARLTSVSESIVGNALTLSLATSAPTFRQGESLVLTMTAKNLTAKPITITFGGQKFDFFALPLQAMTDATNRSLRLPPSVWNWAYDKVFIQIVTSVTLAPGDSLQYTVDWDGKNNDGVLLEGDFFLGGQLVATPGGMTPLKEIQITR